MLSSTSHEPVMNDESVKSRESTVGSGERRPSEDVLFTRVYDSLKGLAHTVRAGRAGETLNTTALVHEVFLKLRASGSEPWKDESHFFAVAARAMRQILVDAARRSAALKRGGRAHDFVAYDDSAHAAPIKAEELIELDAALERLTAMDPRRAQVVEHRIFGGLSTADTAKVLGISTGTVERDWRAARAWLSSEIDRARPTSNEPVP
jgi:RNA polymerase sigma factor (TIGR02999 family)